jgi:hypothetical protein
MAARSAGDAAKDDAGGGEARADAAEQRTDGGEHRAVVGALQISMAA